MLNKKNTIRFRISFFALLIMVFTIFIIVGSLSYIQSLNRQIITVDLSALDVNVPKDEQKFIMQVQERLAERQRQEFLQFVIISGITLTVGGMLIFLMIRKELRALEQLSRQIEKIDFQKNEEENLLKIENPREEIMILANTFNNMIRKLEHAYFVQKRFSQSAAHELKTPITVMLTTLDVAKITKKVENGKASEVIDVITEQVKRMENLVTDLLQINTIQEIEVMKVDVKKLLKELVEHMKPQLVDKEVKVKIEGKLTLQTDVKLLKIVLNNLLENAVKYNKVGGKITCTLGETIKITDTGIGIAKDEIHKIFQSFYCVDQSRSKDLGGFGLGLAIVKESLDRLNYTIAVESEPSVGTTFTISYNS